MTNHPHPTPPPFRPVPAIHVFVEMRRKGECRVRIAGKTATGATLREAIDTATKEQTP